MGEHENTLTPAIDLNTHITDIVNLLLKEDLRDVVLVGHSYGGAVITGVADRVPERVRHLIFLDAVLVDSGESMFSVHPKELQELMGKVSLKDHGLTLPPPPAETFGVTDPATIGWVNARLTPQPYRCFTQPLVLKHPYGNGLPLSYIACTKPELPMLQVFAARTRRSAGWTYYELPTSHDAMLTMPAETAALLQTISKR